MRAFGIQDYVVMTLTYFGTAGLLYLLLGLTGTIASEIVNFFRRSKSTSVLKTIWLFVSLLYLIGIGFNIIWNTLIFGKLYWTFDYMGHEAGLFWLYIYDDPKHNIRARYLHGMSEWSIRGMWFGFVVLSWSGTAWLTRRIKKNEKATKYIVWTTITLLILSMILGLLLPC